jgi:hypothetical protein
MGWRGERDGGEVCEEDGERRTRIRSVFENGPVEPVEIWAESRFFGYSIALSL